MKKFLAMALALLMVAVLLPVTAMAAEGSIDLDTFIKALEEGNYTIDGAEYSEKSAVVNGKLVVKWRPVSGCFDELHMLGDDCPKQKATGNTPKRLNSGLLQFQLFDGKSNAVTVKNVRFVYEPADVKICINSDWRGTFKADAAPAGQLFFLTTGDVSFENCEFDRVVLSTFNTTGSSSVSGCTFANVYNSYAIKDIRGKNVSVTNTSIVNCGGGIMISSKDAVGNVNVTGNTFNRVDVENTAAQEKVGTRALIQIASSGDYNNANFNFNNNEAIECGPIMRQLNTTAVDKVNEQGNSLKAMSPNGSVFTVDSNERNTEAEKDFIPPKQVSTPIIIYTPVSSPVFLSGANQTVAPGSAATFRIDKEFSELQSVAVDGVTLDKSNYKAWSGSTYVELTAAYMKTLAVGTHTLSVYFTGDTATTTFTISKDATKNPTTGANDFVGVAAAAAVMALLGSAVLLRKK